MSLIKRLLAKMPVQFQTELKRIHYGRQIKNNAFSTKEPEKNVLHKYIGFGDWVIDVGANVGHYSKIFSDLAGEHGRVIALEPVPTTFSLLSANTELFKYSNVTLINAAASDQFKNVGIFVPDYSNGIKNYYQAHVSKGYHSPLSVIALPLDSLQINKRVALVKIDAEGHEAFVLAGMKELLIKYQPALIVENPSEEIRRDLRGMGYSSEVLDGSPNTLFLCISTPMINEEVESGELELN